MQLSKNLALAEVTRSETAKRKGISNMPTPEHIENFKKLAENVFQPIREHFGVPIHISSGYRSKALNTAVGEVCHHNIARVKQLILTWMVQVLLINKSLILLKKI